MKNGKKIVIIEIIIVFFVFVFPSYLSQDITVDPALFSSFRFNITYIVSTLPQIAILLLILYLGSGMKTGGESKLQEVAEEYGFSNFDISLVWKTGFVCIGTFAIALAASLLSLLPAVRTLDYLQPVQWEFPGIRIMPLVFITCMSTGYREEMLFRSYFLTRFRHAEMGKLPALLLTAILFAAGHIYQGLPAVAATFCIGLFLGFVFLRFHNIHMIAVGHGLYNFFSLILFPFIVTFQI
jgi:uncharacterized protein